MQDIPKIFTALAEWLSCVFVILEYRKNIEKEKRKEVCTDLVLAMPILLIIQILCGMVANVLWLVGMAVAVLVMVLTIQKCLKIGIKGSMYLTARGFLKAEFLASLEWQIYYYYFHPQMSISMLVETCFCIIFYVVGYVIIGWIEQRFFADLVLEPEMTVATRHLTLVWSVAILIFALSNLSYVSVQTPFTGTGTMEIFNIRTLFAFAGVLMMEAFHVQKLDSDRKQENDAIHMILQQQYIQFRASQENIDIINRKYHDLKHQLQIIRLESDNGKRIAYLDEIEQGIKRYEMENKTGNSVLDTILMSKTEMCLKSGISMTVVADGKLLNRIHVMDICTIFGNALDNAIEYELQVEDTEKRLIHLTVSEKNKFTCVVIENYYQGESVIENQIPETTKKNKKYHGYGVKSIRYSVEKYGGYLNIGVKDDWFRLEMIFPKAYSDSEK